MSFLRMEGLVKKFGDFTAVERVDLSVEKGEFVSLLGPSGCGKTTTLQMIAGFVEPTEGRIIIDGRDITDVKANQRGLGIVFQSYALFPHMTVFDNVGFGLEMRGVAKDERRQRIGRAEPGCGRRSECRCGPCRWWSRRSPRPHSRAHHPPPRARPSAHRGRRG